MSLKKLTLCLSVALLAAWAGCGQDTPGGVPAPTAEGPRSADKDGTEALGAPTLTLATGSGIAHGGVSMEGVSSAELTVSVPANAEIRQVLLYWAGGTTAASGDEQVSLDGVPVQGQLIGGPTWFYTFESNVYRFSAYRADITDLDLVTPGVNTLTLSDFSFTTMAVDENNGASVVVIWDDGGTTGIQLRDGLDMAYYGFSGVLNTTVPQTFAVTPAASDRLADLVILAASVGRNRPTRVLVTTTAGVQMFEDPMGGLDGTQWDSRQLPILIPAGATEVTVQVVSTESNDPRGASLGWVCAALAVPAAGEGNLPYAVSGTVFIDADGDGLQDPTELGLPGVVVDLVPVGGGGAMSVGTDAQGRYAFAAAAGAYDVVVDPLDHVGSFNADLAASFTATTPLSRPVTVGPDATGNDFGFEPSVTRLLEDIRSGAITTDGLTQGMWRQIFRCAILAEQLTGELDEEYGRLEREPVQGDDCGDVYERLYYDAYTLRELLATVQGLFLPEPFQFAGGHELIQAYKLLAAEPRDVEEDARQELLVTELNFVSGRGTVGRLDLMASVASWVESLFASSDDDKSAAGNAPDKDRSTRLGGALQVMEAINTGGGGGVDE